MILIDLASLPAHHPGITTSSYQRTNYLLGPARLCTLAASTLDDDDDDDTVTRGAGTTTV
jgi:hypothetical protein